MLSYSINFSLWYQLHIIVPSFCFVLYYNCPFDIQGFATQRLGLFEEVLPSLLPITGVSCYKPKSKSLGEMATDIMAKASLATNDADLQAQLGLKAFLQPVPRNIGRGLRRRHFVSVKEALDEARFLQSVEEEENRVSGKIFTVEEDYTICGEAQAGHPTDCRGLHEANAGPATQKRKKRAA